MPYPMSTTRIDGALGLFQSLRAGGAGGVGSPRTELLAHTDGTGASVTVREASGSVVRWDTFSVYNADPTGTFGY